MAANDLFKWVSLYISSIFIVLMSLSVVTIFVSSFELYVYIYIYNSETHIVICNKISCYWYTISYLGPYLPNLT